MLSASSPNVTGKGKVAQGESSWLFGLSSSSLVVLDCVPPMLVDWELIMVPSDDTISGRKKL